ncbi:MAG: alpha/beta hydrolase [Cytophagales bacterium]|nr:MAG: alpha/beta hydrolase [Cytophagales bacterium]
MQLNIRKEGDFEFIDEGNGEILLLLHGLFGALSNWAEVVNYFSKTHRVIIPMLPIYNMPLREAGLNGLVRFVEKFVNFKKINQITILGNSLGGHIGLIYTLKNTEKVKRLVLTGSSGLFEDSMGGSYPKRGNYEYIKERVAYTFYDPHVATKALVDEIFEVMNSISKCLCIVAVAKSAQRHNMANDLIHIKIPTLLVWGLNDTITPPLVAHEFDALLPMPELKFIDRCCHAPMMEHPHIFNQYLSEFLEKYKI